MVCLGVDGNERHKVLIELADASNSPPQSDDNRSSFDERKLTRKHFAGGLHKKHSSFSFFVVQWWAVNHKQANAK
ncbi:MAG: hypothetical protein K0R43_3178 [Pseudoduganella sp.]|jgi:hypothetical protein|nr:hypothetical protein [Pseudoduganella sp.]